MSASTGGIRGLVGLALSVALFTAGCTGSPPPPPEGLRECQAFSEAALNYVNALEDMIQQAAETLTPPEHLPSPDALTSTHDSCMPFKGSSDKRVQACINAGSLASYVAEKLVSTLQIISSSMPEDEKDAYLSIASEVLVNKMDQEETARAACLEPASP